MKKLLLLTALLSTSAFSATTGTLLLQGIIPKILSITVTPQTISSTLDLSTNQTDLLVGVVNERSNSLLGYKVTITSSNLSNLKRVSGTEVFPYTMKYNNVAVNLSAPAGTTFTTPSPLPANINKNINISYTGVAQETMVEGTYSDVVTFTIASN